MGAGRGPWVRLLGAFLAALIPTQGQTASDLPDLRTIQHQTHKLAQLKQEIDDATARTLRRVTELEQRLLREERSLTGTAVDAASVRGARLDVVTSQSALAVVNGRIEQHDLGLGRLRGQIDELARDLGDDGQLVAADLRREAGLRLLNDQESETEAVLIALHGLAGAARRQGELLSQRLRLLQSRLELSSIDRGAMEKTDQRIPVLEAVISDFMLHSARASRDLEAVVGDTPSADARRRVLEGQINDSITRGFLRQNDLELVHTENKLDALSAMRADDTMPVHVLRDGASKLDAIEHGLDRIGAALEEQARGIDARQATLISQGTETETQRQVTKDLRDLMAFQRQDIAKLRERLKAEKVVFAAIIGETATAGLLEQRPLPTALADWQRILAAVRDLPRLAADSGSELVRTLASHTATADRTRLAALALGGPLLALLTFWGRRRLGAFARDETGSVPLALGADAAARALPAALPAALWTLTALVLGLRPGLAIPILMLLALWPSAVFLLWLSHGMLSGQIRPAPAASRSAREQSDITTEETTDDPDDVPARATEPADAGPAAPGRRLYLHLRIGVVIATLVAALHLLTTLLPLPPLLADLLDRLGMLAFLALLPPAAGIARALRERTRGAPRQVSRGLCFVSTLARGLPGFVLVTGLAGVAGYTNLAWTLIDYSLWLLLVALCIFLGIGVLRDLAARIDARLLSSAPQDAEFWRSHFIEPGRRLAQLGLYASGGYALLRLWGWDAQTPMVRKVQDLAASELFKLGGAPFTAGDILITLVLIAAVLWIGGWSQQVSFHLAYRRVRDIGLRQALATFTRYLVIVVGLLLALTIIGFDLTALTVFAASLGVGIGFGLQNIVNNFISGILLLAERPLRIGDYVSIGSDQGTVTQIGIRSLTVLTPDRQEVVIPNGSVISKEFTNWTRTNDTVRQVHYFLIRYDSDRERAIALIGEVLAADPNVLSDPQPGIFIWEYTDQGVRIRVQFCFRFLHGPGGLATRSAVLLEIGRRFEQNDIAFAEIGMLRGMAEQAFKLEG